MITLGVYALDGECWKSGFGTHLAAATWAQEWLTCRYEIKEDAVPRPTSKVQCPTCNGHGLVQRDLYMRIMKGSGVTKA